LEVDLQEKGINVLKGKSIWRNSLFVNLWISSIISGLAFNFYTIALPLMVYRLTQSTLAMSTLRAIEIFPNIVLGVVIGVLIDRYNRKIFMLSAIGTQIVVVSFIIVLLSLNDSIGVWGLYILGFIFFTSSLSYSSAFHATVPLVVEKDQLVKANSIRTFSNTLVSIIAPAIAGTVLFTFSYKESLFVTLIGYIFLFLLILLSPLPLKSKDTVRQNNFKKELIEGWRFLLSSQAMWYLTIMILFVNIASTATGGVFIFFSVDVLGVNEQYLGLIIASSAVGGIVASFFANKIKTKFGIKNVMRFVILSAMFGQLTIFISTNFIYLMIAQFLLGFSVVTINILYHSLRQALTPNELQGRVSGTANMIVMLATPFAYLTAGIVGEFVEVRVIFLASAVIMLLIFIWMLFINKALSEVNY